MLGFFCPIMTDDFFIITFTLLTLYRAPAGLEFDLFFIVGSLFNVNKAVMHH